MTEKERQAYELISSILVGANCLEHFVRGKPVVIMSNDILNLLKYATSEAVPLHRDDDIPTICGYKIQMAHGENVLYVGYNLLTERKDGEGDEQREITDK